MARTTIVMDDSLFKKIKTEAVVSHRTLKDTVVELLKRGLQSEKTREKKANLDFATFRSGGTSVSLHDRQALFARMDDPA